jgi:hypothetical protein
MNLDDGQTCPTCGKWCQRYKRTLNVTMVRSLVWLLENGGEHRGVNFANAPAELLRSKQLATTRLWNLVSQPSGAATGHWRLTPIGVEFVTGRAKTNAWVTEYNGEVDSRSTKMVHIRDVLPGFDAKTLKAQKEMFR